MFQSVNENTAMTEREYGRLIKKKSYWVITVIVNQENREKTSTDSHDLQVSTDAQDATTCAACPRLLRVLALLDFRHLPDSPEL